ncbi:MAG: hypothetical protein WBI55_06305 [Eubacteriales bacterium]
MPLQKCRYCGNIYSTTTNTSVCQNCINIVDDAYSKVRAYLYSDPEERDFESILKETGITEKTLNYLIDEGWVVIDGSKLNGRKKCVTCGVAISEGILCSDCMSKVSGIFKQQNNTTNKEKAKSTDEKTKTESFSGTLPLAHWRNEK